MKISRANYLHLWRTGAYCVPSGETKRFADACFSQRGIGSAVVMPPRTGNQLVPASSAGGLDSLPFRARIALKGCRVSRGCRLLLFRRPRRLVEWHSGWHYWLTPSPRCAQEKALLLPHRQVGGRRCLPGLVKAGSVLPNEGERASKAGGKEVLLGLVSKIKAINDSVNFQKSDRREP